MLRPKFDSTFFVAFKLTHEALDAALKKASELNITQYRVLVKLLTAGTAGLPQKDVSALLDLKPNVVTQAINTLEERGLALRANGATDKRFRRARATSAGGEHAAHVNAAIVEELYDLFPTDNAAWRKILEASIAAGADIGVAFADVLVQAVATASAVWTIVAISVAVVGARPEVSLAPWAGVVASFALTLLGPTFGLDDWVLGISPFWHVPDVTATNVDLSGLGWISLVTAGLLVVGFVGFRRRDLAR